MQAFLEELRARLPGVTFDVLAHIGGGSVPVHELPDELVPPGVSVFAEWRTAHGMRRAMIGQSAHALRTNPRMFAKLVADRFRPIVETTQKSPA